MLIDPQSAAAFGLTIAQAVEALKKPLVLGDPVQIKARAIMEEIRKAEHALLRCEHDYARRNAPCACVSSMQPGIVRAALLGIKDRRIGRYAQNSFEEINRCF